MIVTKSNFEYVLRKIYHSREYASLDTETTGLKAYHEDRLFSIIIGIRGYEYYFNFNNNPDHLGNRFNEDEILDYKVIPKLYNVLKNKTIFMHNALFDLSFLVKEGLDLSECDIHDTLVGARIEKNDRMKLDLDTLAKEIGHEKLDIVKQYADKNKLYTWIEQEGKKKREKKRFYNLVPQDIIIPYAEADARITLQLGLHQLKKLKEIDEKRTSKQKSIFNILDQEKKLIKVLFDMQERGIKLDVEYTKEAYGHEKKVFEAKQKEFEEFTGMDFLDSNKVLKTAFDKLGEKYPLTPKGNPSFTDDALSQMKTPLAQIVKDYRKSYKKANSYFLNFLNLVDKNGFLHPNYKSAGTITGRFSVVNPATQTLQAETGEEKYSIRKCIVPDKGNVFYFLDFQAMEYRLMLDYSSQLDLIELIKNGHDVHQACADLLGNGIQRKQAKNISFALLYGASVTKFSEMSGMSWDAANTLKNIFFSKLPKVKQFMENVKATAERRSFIFDCYGRVFNFKDKNLSYKSVNALIQGACSSIMKQGMIKVYDFLKDKKTKIVKTVHDELILEGPKEEMYLIKQCMELMENAYTYKYLPMKVEAEWSETSWGEKQELEL